MATDIAFALAVLAVIGSHLPTSARVFLLSLATVDDATAITIIAAVFTDTINLVALAAAVALCGIHWVLQRRRVTSPLVYVPVAVATWAAVHTAGVHATIAGVALAMLTRVRSDPGEQRGTALRLEHRLQPWSAGVAVPPLRCWPLASRSTLTLSPPWPPTLSRSRSSPVCSLGSSSASLAPPGWPPDSVSQPNQPT